MGYLFNGDCYQTQAVAESAYYSAQPMQQTPGSTTYRTFYKWSGTSWQHIGESIASNGAVSSLWAVSAAEAAFPSCDATEAFTDGMTLGWGVATAMVMAWGWVHLRRQMR